MEVVCDIASLYYLHISAGKCNKVDCTCDLVAAVDRLASKNIAFGWD